MTPAIYNRTASPGGPQQRVPNRAYVIKANDIPTNEEAVPLKVFYGTQQLTGHFAYPVWRYRKQRIEQDVPKGDSVVVGYNYFGSFVLALAIGPADVLHRIRIEKKVIWEGPLTRDAADDDGKSIITLPPSHAGVINFYWGTDTQVPDSLLEELLLDVGDGIEPVIPAGLPRVIYAVCSNMAWGRQPVPPVLTFDVSRYGSALELSSHEINGDAVIPEIVYEWLTDRFFGLGLDVAAIDAPSFVEAAETLITEGVAVSPLVDEFSNGRELLAKFHQYVDGFTYLKEGKIHFRLVRPGDDLEPVIINEAHLAEEPEPANSGWEQTWNFTRVSFSDRNKDWDTGVGAYDDPANAVITGENRSKQFDMPWITRQVVADTVAARLGKRGGIPAATWRLSLLPSFRTLFPGRLLDVSYAKLGISHARMRVVEISRGTPEKAMVEIMAIEEPERHTTGDSEPDDIDLDIPTTVGVDGEDPEAVVTATPRIAALPVALKDGTFGYTGLDGFLAAVNRPSTFTTQLGLYWTWDPAIQDYELLSQTSAFPIAAEVIFFHPIRQPGNWLLRIRLTNWDYTDFASASTASNFWLTVGHRKWKTDDTDEHQAVTLWGRKQPGGRLLPVAPGVFDIEVTDAEYGTPNWALETADAEGQYPTQFVYFGHISRFAIITTNAFAFDRELANGIGDTDLKRYVKAPIGNGASLQSLSDVTAVTFDRNDATMCPDGTLSRDWGVRAFTGYEYFDLAAAAHIVDVDDGRYATAEDLDVALFSHYDRRPSLAEWLAANFEPEPEETHWLLGARMDLMLAEIVVTGTRIYNGGPPLYAIL